MKFHKLKELIKGNHSSKDIRKALSKISKSKFKKELKKKDDDENVLVKILNKELN